MLKKNLLQNILNAKQNIGKYNGNTHINRLIQFDPFNIIWWHGRKRVAGEDKKTASQHSMIYSCLDGCMNEKPRTSLATFCLQTKQRYNNGNKKKTYSRVSYFKFHSYFLFSLRNLQVRGVFFSSFMRLFSVSIFKCLIWFDS